MDKDTLKNEIRIMLEKVQADGYEIAFAGIPPFLPEYDKPVKLQILMPQFKGHSYSAISLITDRIFEHFDLKERGKIWRVETCQSIADIACREEDIIINRINYKPLNIPYRLLEMV